MGSCLTTKWIQLLAVIHEKDRITFKDQKVYKSDTFYTYIDEFERLGWVESGYEGNGCAKLKFWEMTLDGGLAFELIFDQLKE